MPMTPAKGEDKQSFVSRCASEISDAHPDWANDRVIAACNSMWAEGSKKFQKQIAPEEDESRADFISRCMDELGDEDECALAWEERRIGSVIHRTHASDNTHGLEYILSDATPDRMGDVIVADGWDLTNFKKNPVALFNHNTDFVIGKWKNLHIADNSLRGNLQLAPPGTSDRIDEIRKLIEADILRAVSVGFRPVDHEPRKGGGYTYTKSELVETSLVAVPANPNALAIAKSLNISARTVAMVFGGKANKEDQSVARRGINGGQAETSRTKSTIMSPLTKRIDDNQQALVTLREQLTKHLESVDDDNVTDEQLAMTQELNKKIAAREASLAALKDSEARLAKTSDNGDGTATTTVSRAINNGGASRRPFSLAPKKIDPIEFLVRAGTIRALSKSSDFAGKSLDDIRQIIYGDDEATKVICDLTLKAATAPAMTTVTGWAAELVQQINAELMPSLLPSAVYPSLSAMGLRLTFGRNGKINVPTRAATPTVSGSFVGEGAPIPVRQAAFTTTALVPKKMAVITTWTREMDEHSVPAIEGLLRNAIQEDTQIAIDTVLLDANPATTIRPAGLRSGVAGLTPTAGGGFTAFTTDIKALTGAILTATNGNIRNMVFIMNPQQALNVGFITPPAGAGGAVFPFAAEINNNRIAGYPVIKSGTVPLGTVICMDAADYVSITGDTPRFEISDQATLHMEDTSPAHIGSAGTPPVVAAPVVSMFQTDSLALRLILPMNWAVRRSGVISWVAGVTW